MAKTEALTIEECEAMKHALGGELRPEADAWRNHYATYSSDDLWTGLESRGLARRSPREIPGGLVYFHVTTEGRRALAARETAEGGHAEG